MTKHNFLVTETEDEFQEQQIFYCRGAKGHQTFNGLKVVFIGTQKECEKFTGIKYNTFGGKRICN